MGLQWSGNTRHVVEKMNTGRQSPKWLDRVVLTGAALALVGVRPPILAPENAILVEVERV